MSDAAAPKRGRGRPRKGTLSASKPAAVPTVELDAKYQTLDGLKSHPLWEELGDQQRLFLLTYIDTRDGKAAVRAGYPNTSDANVRAMASQLLRNYRIRTLLTLFYGRDVSNTSVDKTELLALLSNRLRMLRAAGPKNGREFAQVAILYAELKGWRERPNMHQDRREIAAQPDKPTGNEEQDVMAMVLAMEQKDTDEKED